MSDWRSVPLRDVTTKIGSGSTPRGGKAVYRAEGVAFIRSQNVYDGRFSFDGLAYLSDEAAHALRGVSVHPGDVLINITGESVTRTALVPRSTLPARVSQHVAILRPDPGLLDSRFLMSALLSPPLKAHLDGLSSAGATRRALTKGHLGATRISLPPLDEQRRIAAVLGAFDDLIETNRTLVGDHWSALEAAYERAASMGRATILGELMALRYGKSLPATRREPGPVPVVSSGGITGSHSSALVRGPGVVVGRKGTVGSVTWVFEDFFPIDTAFYVESELPMLYAYFALRGAGLNHMNTDSAVPGLNRDNTLQRPARLPSGESLAEFRTATTPLMTAVRELDSEAADLTRTRDELLPLLMSGRVRVEDMEGVV